MGEKAETTSPHVYIHIHIHPTQAVQQLEALNKDFNTELKLRGNLRTFSTKQPHHSTEQYNLFSNVNQHS